MSATSARPSHAAQPSGSAFILKKALISALVALVLFSLMIGVRTEAGPQGCLIYWTRFGDLAALVGTVEEILVEGPDKTGARFTGRTRGNRVCIFDASPRLIGTLVPLKIARASVSTLYGELVLSGVPDPA